MTDEDPALAALRAAREQALARLASLDRAIAELAGAAPRRTVRPPGDGSARARLERYFVRSRNIPAGPTDLAAALDIKRAAVSQALRLNRQFERVSRGPDGRSLYRLTPDAYAKLKAAMEKIIKDEGVPA